MAEPQGRGKAGWRAFAEDERQISDAQQPLNPKVTTLTGAAAVASLLLAVAVVVVGFLQTPTYEASAEVRVGFYNRGAQQTFLADNGAGLQALIQAITYAIHSRPVADEVVGRTGLQMPSPKFLSNLTVSSAGLNTIRITYEDTDPLQSADVANTTAEVSGERISQTNIAGSKLTATVVQRASVPESPVRPNPIRNGISLRWQRDSLSVWLGAPSY